MRLIACAVLCLACAGCVSSAEGPGFSQSAQAPVGSGMDRIYVFRTDSFYLVEAPQVASAEIAIDGKVVGHLSKGGYLTADIPAGQHAVAATSGGETTLRYFIASPGSPVYVRIEDKTRMEGAGAVAGGLVGGAAGGAVAGAIQSSVQEYSSSETDGRIWAVQFEPPAEALQMLQDLRLS